ncbi:MAG: hypothetical protein KGL99_06810 [Burkholderiales bacterium]|nr:hypothetical protein [Burkholderiales bacterium]
MPTTAIRTADRALRVHRHANPTTLRAMISRLRTAFVWLMLFALPLQGYAAATLLHCGPSHHRAVAAAPAGAHDQAMHGDDHAAGHTGADGAGASAGVGDDGASLGHLDKLSKSKCSACASCCVGAALPTATLEFAAVAGAFVPTPFVPVSRVGFYTDSPDRPPRLVHA